MCHEALELGGQVARTAGGRRRRRRRPALGSDWPCRLQPGAQTAGQAFAVVSRLTRSFIVGPCVRAKTTTLALRNAYPACTRTVPWRDAAQQEGNHDGSARRLPHHRDGRHRPGAVRRHAAGRHGRRGDPRRPARGGRPRPAGRDAEVRRAAPRPPLASRSTSSQRRRRRVVLRLAAQRRRADRRLPAGRDGAAGARPRRAARAQSPGSCSAA